MTRTEKTQILEKIWETYMQDNPEAPLVWRKTSRSFIRWSLKKLASPEHTLSVCNHHFPHLLRPYNLCYKPADDPHFCAPHAPEGREEGESQVLDPTNPSKKLTEDDVRTIRQMLDNGALQKDMAAAFDVSTKTISGIANGKTWKNVK